MHENLYIVFLWLSFLSNNLFFQNFNLNTDKFFDKFSLELLKYFYVLQLENFLTSIILFEKKNCG